MVYATTSPIAEVVYHEVSVLVFLQCSNIAMESPPRAAPQEESDSVLQFDDPAGKRGAAPGCETPGKRAAPVASTWLNMSTFRTLATLRMPQIMDFGRRRNLF